MPELTNRNEFGPIYGVQLINSLPADGGGMIQAMPTRADLESIRHISGRVVAGFEVLLFHYRQLLAEKEKLAQDKKQAVDIVFLSLLDCSDPSLTSEDIRGNAVVIISKLHHAGIITSDQS